MVALKEQLAARGYKITPQRRLILEALNDADRHLSMMKLQPRLKIEPSISLALYRNLNMLVDIHLVGLDYMRAGAL